MRSVYFMIGVLTLTLVSAQESDGNGVDSIIDVTIQLSEAALYEADFERALELVSQKQLFTDQQEIQLLVQRIRIEGFRNLLYQNRTNHATNLNRLMNWSEVVENLPNGLIKAKYYRTIGSTLRSLKKPDSSSFYDEKAYDLFFQYDDMASIAEMQAGAISRKHNALLKNSDKEAILAMIPTYEREIDFATKYSKYALSYNKRHLAQIYRRQTDNYERALDLFHESLRLREEIGFVVLLPASYSSIGDVFLAKGSLNDAIEWYEKSVQLAVKIGFIRYQLYPNIQIGDIYVKLGDKERARVYYSNALNYAHQNNHAAGILEAEQKIAKLD